MNKQWAMESETKEAPTRWAAVAGYEGLYEVSDLGQVRRIGRAARNGRGHGGGARIGRILRPLPHRGGYRAVQLWKDGSMRRFLLHVIVARAFLGVPPEGTEVNHIDGVKPHNAANNLEYVTRTGNMEHAYRTGLRASGEQHPWSKLSAEQVAEIRKIHATGEMGCRKLGRRFGVAKATIQLIINGRNWANV